MRKLSVVAFALLAAAGCEKQGDKASPEPGSKAGSQDESGQPVEGKKVVEGEGAGRTIAEPGAAKSDGAMKVGDPPRVELLSAGAEPRRSLRLQLAKGDSSRAEMRLDMAMNTKVAGRAAPAVKLPQMRAVMKMTVVDATNDKYDYSFEIEKYEPMSSPGVQPAVLNAMRQQLKTLVGTKGKGKIDNRGFNLGASVDVPPGVSPQIRKMFDGMRDAIAQVSAPLPEEPVGVGGKWSAKMRISQNGVATDVTYTYEVTAIDDKSVTTKVTADMAGVPGLVKNPMLPAGATLNLVKMTGSGSGGLTLQLDNLVPKESQVKVHTVTNAQMQFNGTSNPVDTTVDLATTIKQI